MVRKDARNCRHMTQFGEAERYTAKSARKLLPEEKILTRILSWRTLAYSPC
jgi:hypothetical protein